MNSKVGIYRHFKGNYYEVVGIATDIDTKEKLVLYRQMYDPFEFWLRPEEMFFGKRKTDSGMINRFVKVGESNENIISKTKLYDMIIGHSENENKYKILTYDKEKFAFEIQKY